MEWQALGKLIVDHGFPTAIVAVLFWAALFRACPWFARRFDLFSRVLWKMARRLMRSHVSFLNELRIAFSEQRDHRVEVRQEFHAVNSGMAKTQKAIGHVGEGLVALAGEDKRETVERHVDAAKNALN